MTRNWQVCLKVLSVNIIQMKLIKYADPNTDQALDSDKDRLKI